MGRAETAPMLRVAVAWSPRAGAAFEKAVQLEPGSTALDAIRASGILEPGSGIDLSTQEVGIWGRVVPVDTPLAEGDRVEVYRPLQIDPKEARRLRAHTPGKRR
jgi:putative ubiquitin-RnfH superfamily antitoxin RatB of RatAB toxin-antitoxin module